MSVEILLGDVMARLADLADESVDCVVTSPPYWALRDYGVAGQMGLEPTLGEHLDTMVAVFREVRRVLKPAGTVWVNYGDTYAAHPNGRSAAQTKAAGGDNRSFQDKPMTAVGSVNADGSGTRIKPKDLCMIPARFAIAMCDDGWWLRSEIVWAKPNPMPESIKDRPSTAHEKIFLFSKSARYFYDADAVREPAASTKGNAKTFRGGRYIGGDPNAPRTSHGNTSTRRPPVGGWADSDSYAGQVPGAPKREKKTGPGSGSGAGKKRGHIREHAGFNDRWDLMTKAEQHTGGHNQRNVWTIATRPFSVERCTACGEIYLGRAAKDVARIRVFRSPRKVCRCGASDRWLSHFATFPPEIPRRCILAGCPVGGVVLDPFAGAGTTGLVADELRRHAILIELNPDYAAIAEHRIEAAAPPLFGVGGCTPPASTIDDPGTAADEKKRAAS